MCRSLGYFCPSLREVDSSSSYCACVRLCFCDLGGCNGFQVAVKQPPVVYQLVKWVNNLNAIKKTFNFMRRLDHRPAVKKCFHSVKPSLDVTTSQFPSGMVINPRSSRWKVSLRGRNFAQT